MMNIPTIYFPSFPGKLESMNHELSATTVTTDENFSTISGEILEFLIAGAGKCGIEKATGFIWTN